MAVPIATWYLRLCVFFLLLNKISQNGALLKAVFAALQKQTVRCGAEASLLQAEHIAPSSPPLPGLP